MSWCKVRPSRRGMRTMARLACSVALRIASGTSRALPAPCPTRPLPSPTTTSAAKPKRRPPFTTLATRLIETSFSTNSLSSRSRSRGRPRSRRCSCAISRTLSLERQPGFAGGIGQGFHPAVKQIAAAVEHHGGDAGLLGALGDRLADRLGRLDIGAGLQAAAHVLLDGRGSGERHAARVVDDLRVDVLARAEDR